MHPNFGRLPAIVNSLTGAMDEATKKLGEKLTDAATGWLKVRVKDCLADEKRKAQGIEAWYAVAEIRLGDRAEARNRPRPGEAHGLLGGHVRGVDRAPARGDGERIEQEVHRSPAAEGDAVLDLLHLLGDVDVDEGILERREHGAQEIDGHRAKRMRRKSDAHVGRALRRRAEPVEKAQEAVRVIQEPALALPRRLAAEAAVGVERRQEGDGDAGVGCRGEAAPRHLGAVGVRRAVRLVVQVLELADRRQHRTALRRSLAGRHCRRPRTASHRSEPARLLRRRP